MPLIHISFYIPFWQIGGKDFCAISAISQQMPFRVWVGFLKPTAYELFGSRSVAIEVFPAKKNLVDVADVYHLWVLPKDYQLPFGIHPTRDPQGSPVQRGYDFNMADVMAWNNSPERQQAYSK